MYPDPILMNTFRERIRNPFYWHRVCRVMWPYARGCNLRDPRVAYGMVDGLSGALDHPITPEQREHAAGWLMRCGVDPADPMHRGRMLSMVRGFW